MLLAPTQVKPGGQAQVCEYCHQRPRYGTHPYCGKGCAKQAEALCKHCRQKPKHGTHDYCGKQCAKASGNSQAAFGTASPGNAPAPPPQAQVFNKAPRGGKTHNAVSQKPGRHPHPTANPFRNQMHSGPQSQAPYGSVAVAPPVMAAPQPAVIDPNWPTYMANPHAPAPPNGQGPPQNIFSKILHASLPGKAKADKYDDDEDFSEYPEECRIPGCGKPVYIDDLGDPTEYCSMRHREEAVTSGLESPCIMCLKLPQSEVDYFCSNGCKEEALSKAYET